VHLRSITLKGFKSFPDRTRLEFAPGVSVIVGPNGSGKSNITDAVLWALGEQSPVTVRGQSMQDVIFAGAHGVQARSEAEVEVVIDNGSGDVGVPMSEIAISRRLDRSGEGEYRINGARCRLGEVVELLSDTGLGKEMHSVVSQGRVEAIVTSKPKDRRMLIEEAAGLGKHRKRRRRAQLKLDRTQDNLDRSLDVEREARSRLRPLKRQAEAAELHERLERQGAEARWELARDASRSARAALAAAETEAAAARTAAGEAEAELAAVAQRREAAEAALAARGSEQEGLSARFYAARSALDRVETRQESASAAVATLVDRLERRTALVELLEAEVAEDTGDDGAGARIDELEAELEQLAADRAERLARELAEIETRRTELAAEAARLEAAVAETAAARRVADAACDAARVARRAADTAADAARRESARVGADLAAVNQFLRMQAGAPGGAASLADSLRASPGYELALAAVLGPRLRAAVASDLRSAGALLDQAGRDGGAALVVPNKNSLREGLEGGGDAGERERARNASAEAPPGSEPAPPAPGAHPLLTRVVFSAGAAAAELAEALLARVWVVDDIESLPEDFTSIAVTKEGRVWDGSTRELRQVPEGGEDKILAERNRRDALIAESAQAASAEALAKAEQERHAQAVATADRARDDADRTARAAARAHQEALDAERHQAALSERRSRTPDDEATATRRAQVGNALAAERKLLDRAAREREARATRIAQERERGAADRALIPLADRLAAALHDAAEGIREQVARFDAALRAEREAGEQLAAGLRACAQQEAEVQTRLKARGEAVTRAEVRAQQVRDQAKEAEAQLTALADRLGFVPEPADQALPEAERAALSARIERLARRREQLGPVNPLAQDEYAEAVAHVEELEAQREDLETAIRELQGIIKDTDERIRLAFEETFTAAAKNFEEMVGQLFPGGRGRLRLVREDSGPRSVLAGGDEESAEASLEAAAEAEERDEDDVPGVEIEITPAGKATKRLSLLSGGEKSMTALAFMFAVFLARPCPFYILDEVEAALDDLNIDRFLTVLRRYSDRAQFIVVTHQKRTMEAADCLYGVSMAGNGVSKVVSRRLPKPQGEAAVA
jgi:chromosome segregation protein